LRGGSLIQNQSEYTACGPDELRGETFDIFGAEEDFFETGGFVGSADEEEDFSGVVDNGPGEGDAPGVLLWNLVGDDEAADFVDGFGVREERGGVAVVAHAEGDDIEARGFGAFEAEAAAQVVFVLRSGYFWLEFALHAVNLLGAHADFIEERFAGHAVVAFGVVGRDGAFIDEEELERGPRHAIQEWMRGVGEQRECSFGRRSAGYGDADTATGGNGFFGQFDKM